MAGRWEGDLIVGRGNRTAIGTTVDRTTRYVQLLHLPDGRTADHVRDALVHTFAALPSDLAGPLPDIGSRRRTRPPRLLVVRPPPGRGRS